MISFPWKVFRSGTQYCQYSHCTLVSADFNASSCNSFHFLHTSICVQDYMIYITIVLERKKNRKWNTVMDTKWGLTQKSSIFRHGLPGNCPLWICYSLVWKLQNTPCAIRTKENRGCGKLGSASCLYLYVKAVLQNHKWRKKLCDWKFRRFGPNSDILVQIVQGNQKSERNLSSELPSLLAPTRGHR